MYTALRTTFAPEEAAELMADVCKEIEGHPFLCVMARAFDYTDAMATGVLIGIAISKRVTK